MSLFHKVPTYGLKLYEHKENQKDSINNRYIIAMYKNGKENADFLFDWHSEDNFAKVKDKFLIQKRNIAIALESMEYKELFRKVPLAKGEKYNGRALPVDRFESQIELTKKYNQNNGKPEIIDKDGYICIAEYSSKQNGIHDYAPLKPEGEKTGVYFITEDAAEELQFRVINSSVKHVSYDTFVSSFLPENMTECTKELFFEEKKVYLHTQEPEYGNICIFAKDTFDALRLLYEKHPEARKEILEKEPLSTYTLPYCFSDRDAVVSQPLNCMLYTKDHIRSYIYKKKYLLEDYRKTLEYICESEKEPPERDFDEIEEGDKALS